MSAFVFFVLSCIYGLLTLFLNVVIIHIIWKHRSTFKSTFYYLFVFDAILNMITFINTFIMYHLSTAIGPENTLATIYSNQGAQIEVFLSYQLAFMQYTSTFLISLNRVFVCYKLANSGIIRIWDHTNKKLRYTLSFFFMVICYLAPVGDTHRLLVVDAYTYYSREQQQFMFVIQMKLDDQFLILNPFIFTMTLFSLFVNIQSIRKIFRFTKTHFNNNSRRQKTEVSLVYWTLVTCASQVFGVTISFLRVYGNFDDTSMLSLLAICSDFLSLHQPWILLCFSKDALDLPGSTAPVLTSVCVIERP
ncbi:hypothetical protein CAEBREN_21580 [Caenorhabditis brenneri]|uniref:Serpentine receptor class gamma n=1 Tax=Caenorhabditis brenneri TaxID=135651 RepID=G0PBJ7_CAEBE|nr:hypothetical protein CAEBREN_21580 [Caenorhabditis brenneri]